MTQSSLTHSLCLHYRAPGTRLPMLFGCHAPYLRTVSPGFAFQKRASLLAGIGAGGGASISEVLTSFPVFAECLSISRS